VTVSSTRVDGGWFVQATELPAGVAPAIGHWLEELGASDVDAGSDHLEATVPRAEPFRGALEWLVSEFERGRSPFEALGFAAAHIDSSDERSGVEVLREASGEPPANAEEEALAVSERPTHAAPPRGRLETIGGIDMVTDPAPLDSTPMSETDAAAETIPPDAVESSPPKQPPKQPPNRRSKLEPIGYDPEVLKANLDASVAAADTLPDADSPGTFDLHLVSAGPDPSRTAAMLVAALGVDKQEAAALCASLPAQVGSALVAREARRVDAIVRPATGATFRAVPTGKSQN
jgi:hypothetical protein